MTVVKINKWIETVAKFKIKRNYVLEALIITNIIKPFLFNLKFKKS